jgi:hypothetical protein
MIPADARMTEAPHCVCQRLTRPRNLLTRKKLTVPMRSRNLISAMRILGTRITGNCAIVVKVGRKPRHHLSEKKRGFTIR